MKIHDIQGVFGEMKHPGRGLPRYGEPSEWDYIYDNLRTKDWRNLTVNDIDAHGGIIEGIQCLSAEGFVYFLPGLINLTLDDKRNRYTIVQGIVSRLTGSDEQGKSALADPASVLALLSSRQRQFLVKFLLDAVQQEPMMCPVDVNSAVHNLEQGKIDAYRQEDVSQWAQTISKMGKRL